MGTRGRWQLAGWFLVLAVCAPVALAAPQLLATMGTRASFSVDGSPPVTIQVGDTSHGIRLISVAPDSAEIETGGKHSTLTMSQASYTPDPHGKAVHIISLASALDGRYHAWLATPTGHVRGHIEPGFPGLFMSLQDARALGIRVDGAPADTMAAEKEPLGGKLVTVHGLKLEGVAVPDVEVSVNWRSAPDEPVIGASVLKNFVINRDGKAMTLTKQE